MCSRYTLISKPSLVATQFELAEIDDFPGRYNIAPSQPVGIIRTGYDRAREFALVRWGLIPDWVKDPGEFTTLVNARCESVHSKPSFRNALKYRRCLFPLNGFYEWSGPKGQRQAHYIKGRTDVPIGVAGLWECWMGPDGSEIDSAVIITTRANQDLSKIHKRMPVIIDPSDYDEWLDCMNGTTENIKSMLRPAELGVFKHHGVSNMVNNPVNTGADLIVPIGQLKLF